MRIADVAPRARLERDRVRLRAREGHAGELLAVAVRVLQVEVVDRRFVGDDELVRAVLEARHLRPGLLERDREAGADRPRELRSCGVGGDGDCQCEQRDEEECFHASKVATPRAAAAAPGSQSASPAASSGSGRNSAWRRSIREPWTSTTSKRTLSQTTSSPCSGARPSWPKTKPATVW